MRNWTCSLVMGRGGGTQASWAVGGEGACGRSHPKCPTRDQVSARETCLEARPGRLELSDAKWASSLKTAPQLGVLRTWAPAGQENVGHMFLPWGPFSLRQLERGSPQILSLF